MPIAIAVVCIQATRPDVKIHIAIAIVIWQIGVEVSTLVFPNKT